MQRLKTLDTTISREDIVNTYVPKGFTNFKLSGRGAKNSMKLLISYANYMVKPEWKDDFICLMGEAVSKDMQSK